MENNNEYKNYYIAFLDILGFKDLVTNKRCKEILEILEKARYGFKVESTTKNNKGVEFPDSKKQIKIYNKIISDSICLYIEAEDINNLMLLLFACKIMQYELLKCDPPIFIRGGITKGEMYSDGNVIFGPGITQAYLMEERNAKVPRIIITNKILSDIRLKYSEEQIKNLVFKDGDEFYVVDYFSHLNYDQVLKNRVLGYAKNILDTTIDTSLREKYVYVKNKIV